MKADGITLSTVGAGGGANPFLEQLAQAGRRPLLRGREPGEHPGHLPQGDPAGLRPADRRGAVLPDPDVVLADPARPRRRACRSCSATTGRRSSRPPRPSSSPPRDDPLLAQWQYGLGRSVAWTSDSTGRWAKNWVGWSGLQPVLQPARQLDVPGRGDRRHRGHVRDRRRAGRRCTSRASRPTARRATSTRPARVGRRTGPRAADREPGPDRAGRLRGAARRDRSGRLRGPGHADQAGDDAARADRRARRADRRRVPAAGRERAVPRRAPRRRPAGTVDRDRRSTRGCTT